MRNTVAAIIPSEQASNRHDEEERERQGVEEQQERQRAVEEERERQSYGREERDEELLKWRERQAEHVKKRMNWLSKYNSPFQPQQNKEICPPMVCKITRSRKAFTWIMCDVCEQWYHVGLTA